MSKTSVNVIPSLINRRKINLLKVLKRFFVVVFVSCSSVIFEVFCSGLALVVISCCFRGRLEPGSRGEVSSGVASFFRLSGKVSFVGKTGDSSKGISYAETHHLLFWRGTGGGSRSTPDFPCTHLHILANLAHPKNEPDITMVYLYREIPVCLEFWGASANLGTLARVP